MAFTPDKISGHVSIMLEPAKTRQPPWSSALLTTFENGEVPDWYDPQRATNGDVEPSLADDEEPTEKDPDEPPPLE